MEIYFAELLPKEIIKLIEEYVYWNDAREFQRNIRLILGELNIKTSEVKHALDNDYHMIYPRYYEQYGCIGKKWFLMERHTLQRELIKSKKHICVGTKYLVDEIRGKTKFIREDLDRAILPKDSRYISTPITDFWFLYAENQLWRYLWISKNTNWQYFLDITRHYYRFRSVLKEIGKVNQ